ncbi:MAG: flagellar biosynthetic protein FliO [Legionellales bacterium]|nr:flagellar biosynthetic protein FliO [Legionellales bacterium]
MKSFFLLTVLFITEQVYASEPKLNLASTDFGAGKIIQAFIMLIFIIALILILAFFLKRSVLYRGAATGNLKIISTLPLGTKERIVLIQTQENKLLVGVTAHSIRTLHVFNQKQDVE